MELKRINYRNLILKQVVIPKLREKIERLDGNVKYDFPKDKAKFPLIIVNINDSPNKYDIYQNELTTTITITMSMLEEYQSDLMDLEFDVTTCMLEMGFTRSQPSMPYKNANYDKYQIDISYKIGYNLLSGEFERRI
jgi:hypothetical protein